MQVLGACQTSGNTGFVGDNTNQGEKRSIICFLAVLGLDLSSVLRFWCLSVENGVVCVTPIMVN